VPSAVKLVSLNAVDFPRSDIFVDVHLGTFFDLTQTGHAHSGKMEKV
jgi:hypothetical protein